MERDRRIDDLEHNNFTISAAGINMALNGSSTYNGRYNIPTQTQP